MNQDLITGVALFNGFLNPELFYGYGYSAIQAGLLQKAHEAIDTLLTDAVRNNLVTRNLDLFTANVLRGRETGLPGFNQMLRELYTNGPINRANGTDTTARFKGNALF
ncbi:MAG: peroxidase family protein, partial [bacterium]